MICPHFACLRHIPVGLEAVTLLIQLPANLRGKVENQFYSGNIKN